MQCSIRWHRVEVMVPVVTSGKDPDGPFVSVQVGTRWGHREVELRFRAWELQEMVAEMCDVENGVVGPKRYLTLREDW